MPEPTSTSTTASTPPSTTASTTERRARPATAAGEPALARLAILAAGTFAVGTDAFVVAGILPEVGHSLHATVAQAGQVVTVFALAYAALSPVLATLTGTWPRRRTLLTALGLFVVGNLLTAVAPSLALVLASRVIAAAGAALVTPTSSVIAASLVPAHRRARAISIATAGLTLSTALGAPIGTVIGSAWGWRAAIWFVAAVGVLAALGIWRLLPEVASPPRVGVRARLAPLRDARVLGLLLTTLVIFTGIYLVYTYVSVVFDRATGSDGSVLAVLLFVFGVAATAGNFAAGAVADRVGSRFVVGAAAVILALVCATLELGSAVLPAAFVVIAIYGLAAFSVSGPQQHRLISGQPDHAALLVALNASFIYLAVSLSGVLGALIISGLGSAWIGPSAAILVVTALLLSEATHRRCGPGSANAGRASCPGRTARRCWRCSRGWPYVRGR